MTGWTAIVPVRPWHLGRTDTGLPRPDELRRAFALDVLETVTSTATVDRVVLVTAERDLVVPARRLGVSVVADRPLLPGRGMSAAVDLGRRWAVRWSPQAPIAVVPADLPSMTPETLGGALHAAAGVERAVVPDLRNTGTTLVVASSPRSLATGPGAPPLAGHDRSAVCLGGVDETVRCDVDTLEDLVRAHGLGLQRHTRSVTSGDGRRGGAGIESRRRADAAPRPEPARHVP